MQTLIDSIHLNYEDIIKLILSFLLGGIIGFERELKQKPVGFKTCVILSVASCLLTIISIESSLHLINDPDHIRTDPMRLAAQVISGVGFLGAGVILHKKDEMISGLTTATMIWASAGVGITIGAGFYGLAIFSAILILVSIKISSIIAKLRHSKNKVKRIKMSLSLKSNQDIPDYIKTHLQSNLFMIERFNIVDKNKGVVRLDLSLMLAKRSNSYEIYSYFKTLPGAQGITLLQ